MRPDRRGALWGGAVAAPFVAIAAWGAWRPSSYWLDELLSVTFSGGSWSTLYADILRDVHPPLYQVVLKLWTDALGEGEATTRALSLAFGLGAIALWAWGVRKRPPAFAAPATLTLVGTWSWVLYAQMTRGYALLLMLATAATLMAKRARLRGGLAFATLLALSLTHYFGLALALGLLGERLVRGQDRRRLLAWAGALLIWPAWHASKGALLAPTGGDFWITADSPLDTLVRALPGLFATPTAAWPQGMGALRPIAVGVGVGAWAAVALRGPPPARTASQRLGGRIGLFVGAIALIDLHTPISTPRNFLVLLPTWALAAGHVAQTWWGWADRRGQHALAATALTAWLALTAFAAHRRHLHHQRPAENWKGAADALRHAEQCRPHCWFADGDWRGRAPLYAHDFRDLMGPSPEAVTGRVPHIVREAQATRRPVVAAALSGDAPAKLARRLRGWLCLEPPQRHVRGVVVFAPPGEHIPGLRPCRDRPGAPW